MRSKLVYLSLLILLLFVAACGTVATPEWSAEAQGTRAAVAETSVNETESAPTATLTFTPVPPTATSVPPTATLVPPTETLVPPTVTLAPTMDMSAVNTAPAAQVTAALPGDTANGQVLFNELQPQAGFACSTCHRVDSEDKLIGPGLLHASEHAAHHGTGQSAEEYIRTSIVDPGAYVVPDFPDMLMPRIYSQIFTPQEINDLVSYLLTL